MSEHEVFSDLDPWVLFNIDHSLAEESVEQYEERKIIAINEGRPTWLVGNFDANFPVYRLWNKQKLVALVETIDGQVFRLHIRNPSEIAQDVDWIEEDMTMLRDVGAYPKQ